MARKFILACKREDIVGGKVKTAELRFGNVGFHRELLKRDGSEVCLGGGWFSFNNEKKTLDLDEDSTDFGVPQWERPEKIICPTDCEGYTITYTYPNHGEYRGKGTIEINPLVEFGETEWD